MAEDPSALADRVFASVLTPLVLGGAMQPTHAIGARAALALMALSPRPSDADLASRVDLSRVVQARRLAPIDTVDDPSGAEWALAAVLHDLLQVTNPRWIRKSAPRRLLDLAVATLERVPPPASAKEALSRHTWFARLFDVHRQDTSVSWWVGSSEFRGTEPPKRLLRWPELRRVSVARTELGLTELIDHGGPKEHAPAFGAALARFLRATPLTDLASCARTSPPFAWTPEGLALVRAPIARTLALRAVSFVRSDGTSAVESRPGQHQEDADAALGRATRALFAAKEWKDAATALDFLGHRAMGAAQGPGAASVDAGNDATFARAAGAMIARRWLDDPALLLPEAERRRLAPIFDAAARASAAHELAVLTGAPRTTPAV
jgi:hypothetical protein